MIRSEAGAVIAPEFRPSQEGDPTVAILPSEAYGPPGAPFLWLLTPEIGLYRNLPPAALARLAQCVTGVALNDPDARNLAGLARERLGGRPA